MSFNMNPPQWEPKINRPQATNNNGRGSGGGGGYAGGQYKEEKEKNPHEIDIFKDSEEENQHDVDSSISNLFRLVAKKISTFFQKKQL